MIQVTPKQLQEIAATNFGTVYTNPLSSWVVRTVLMSVVTLVAARLNITIDDAQTQGWVDLVLALSCLGVVLVARFKSQGASIKTAQQVLLDYLPVLQAASPAARAHLASIIKEKNPKVYDLIAKSRADLLLAPPK